MNTRLLLIVLLAACGAFASHAQSHDARQMYPIEKRYNIFFRINSPEIDYGFKENSKTIETMRKDIQTTIENNGSFPDTISVVSTASPDGRSDFNTRLARNRAASMKALILDILPPEVGNGIHINIRSLEEDWQALTQVLLSHPEFPQREQMLSILTSNYSPEDQEQALRKCTEGWNHLVENHIYILRNASVEFTVFGMKDEYTIPKSLEENVPIAEPQPKVAEEPSDSIAVMPVAVDEPIVVSDVQPRYLYLKTNTLGLGLAISNISAEIDLAKHWSISVPVYYSALNYFTSTIKFRTLAVQPEIRFWIKESNTGFFFGPHFGAASYNIAVDGDKRYQDHNGTSPALGGGISAGYRMPVSKSDRWHVEFAIGAGAYALKYDTFHNVNNGKLIDTQTKTYWGIDNAAINISYRFGLNKRNR